MTYINMRGCFCQESNFCPGSRPVALCDGESWLWSRDASSHNPQKVVASSSIGQFCVSFLHL
ncbi:hypothetical protein Hanom_Chr14g01245791 [Helianthus anomalus]